MKFWKKLFGRKKENIHEVILSQYQKGEITEAEFKEKIYNMFKDMSAEDRQKLIEGEIQSSMARTFTHILGKK
jgi:hypothetical protein